MKSGALFAVALLLAAGSAVAKVSECETDCEKVYKFCVSNAGKGSERSCKVDLENCRKGCKKKEKATPAA